MNLYISCGRRAAQSWAGLPTKNALRGAIVPSRRPETKLRFSYEFEVRFDPTIPFAVGYRLGESRSTIEYRSDNERLCTQ
jgi:hypothetical protein